MKEAELEAALPDLARAPFEDPGLRTNPRRPLIHELVELLRGARERGGVDQLVSSPIHMVVSPSTSTTARAW